MRKIYKPQKFLRIVLALLIAGFMNTASAQLSGTYTIDSNSVTGGTNFKTWPDFANSITTNGVSAAVTVNVITSNTATSQIVFGPIAGASSTNTIKINGNNNYVQSAIAGAVIFMNGADYMTFDKLTVRNTSTSQYVQGFRFYNASDYNTISNCTIEFSALTTATTAGGAYISFSTTSTGLTTTDASDFGSYNTISKNLMRTTNVNSPGPAYGIAIQGHAKTYTSTAQNNTITSNTIENFYSMAIRMYNTNGNQVLNNNISRANATSNNSSATLYGIYSYNSYAANRPTKLDGNYIHDLPFVNATTSTAPTTVYGFYLYFNYGNANYRLSVSNNTVEKSVAVSNFYLGYSYYSYYLDLIGNMGDKCAVTTSTSSGYNFYGWYTYYTYNQFRINNNTVQNCTGGYYFYGIYNSYPQAPNGVTEISNNLVQNNSKSYYYTYHIYNYYGQYSTATYPINITKNTVKGNSSDYYYMRCISSAYYGVANITDNLVENNYQTNYYYLYCVTLEWYSDGGKVQRNTIRGNYNGGTLGYVYGVYDYYNYRSEVSSNLIYGNKGYYGFYGIYLYDFNSNAGTWHKVLQNTIINDGNQSSYTSHYCYALYMYAYYCPNVEVVGNLIDLKNRYMYVTYAYNYANPGGAFAGWIWNRNSYSITSPSAQYWYNGSTSFSSLAQWVSGASPAGTEEYLLNGHNFTGSYESVRFLNQNNISTYPTNTTDIYGNLRNPSKSDRGAVEGFLDIAQTANTFAWPSPTCAGYTTSPTVTFKNNFAEPVTGFSVACSDNGVLKSVVKFTNTIAINGTNTVTFPPLLFSQAGNHKVKFFLLDADDLPSNDSMTFNFNVLKAPGGTTMMHNVGKSSTAAQYVTTGKPDVTFPDEKLAYDLGAPSRLGYTNSEYNSKWIGTVSAKTINGFPATSTVSFNPPASGNMSYVVLDAPKAWEDSTIEISVKMIDLVTGCDTTYKRKVLIAPKAVPGVRFPAAFCEKNDLIFESTSTVSSGAIDYEWNFGDGSPTTNEASPSHNYATFGQYTVTLKTTTNPHGFTTSKTYLIDVTEVPLATIINTNACEGVAVKLKNGTVYGGSGTINYSWNYGDGSPINNTTSAADIFKTYVAPGGYKVTLQASASGCTNSVTKIIYQFAKPTANFTQATGTCLNTEFKFTNNSSIALGQYGSLWDFDDAGNKATVKEPNYMFSTAGTKNVKLDVVSEFGCTDSKTVQVVVKQIPTTNYLFPFACSRTATPFTNTTNLNGEALLGYNWNFGDGFTSSSTSPLKTWTSIGPRVVSLTTNLVNGCSTTESKIINVGVQPAVKFNVEDRCAGAEVPFTNLTTFSQGDITYTWNFGDGNVSNVAAPVHAYGSGVSQTYTVQLKASIAGGCSDSTSRTVTINPLPTTCTFDINGTVNAAKISPLTFTPTGGATSNIEYIWITGDGNQITSSNQGTQYKYNSTGKYCVTMIARNSAGCECSSTKCVTMTTSIEDQETMNNAVSIYPNPNSGVFNVSLSTEINGNMVVNVYNTLGELVKTVTVDSNVTSIDMSEFASGVYTVKITAENQTAIKKITITK